MGFGSLSFNPHAPGPIGDTTPATLAGTTLGLAAVSAAYTSAQISFDYDGTHRGRMWTASNGDNHWDSPDSGRFFFDIAGTTVIFYGSSQFSVGSGGGPAQILCNRSRNAGTAAFDVTNGGNIGIGDGGAASTLTMMIGGTTYVTLVTTLMTIGVGIQNSNLPTSDPHVVGRWWANLGLVTVSAG